MGENGIVLEATGLTKRFPLSRKQRKEAGSTSPTLTAVDGLSFSLRRGEIFALLGPNGAGKTTTLRMLAGLLNPTSGEIRLFGENLTRGNNELRAKIGFLTSDLKLDPFFTPDYLFCFYSKMYGLTEEQMRERKQRLFSYFGIDSFAFVRISDLSTGMKQKASLAISLCNDPDLVIFDEPTNGLDILSAKAVEDYLLHLRELGKTVIISTHIFSLIDKLADRVCIILKGKKSYEGDMASIKEEGGIEKVFFSCYKEDEI